MKNLALNTELVVCLSAETTQPAAQVNYRRAFSDDRLNTLSKGQQSDSAKALDCQNLASFLQEQGDKAPRTVHLDWTVCSVKDFKVLEVASVIVNPDQPISEATASFTGVQQDHVGKEGVSFAQATEKFEQSIKNSVGAKPFQVIVQADWVHKYQLALDAQRTGVTLPDNLKNCLNILDLHYELLTDKQATDLSDLLRIHELEPIQGPTKAKTNSQSLVRLINRMIRHFKVQLDAEKAGPASAAAAGSHNSNESTEDSKMVEDSNSVKRRSRSRSNEKDNQVSQNTSATAKPTSFGDADVVALKCRGVPFQAQISDVINFFQKWNIEEERIQMIDRDDGRFSGMALVLFNSVDEAADAMNEMQGQNIGHRWIEIFPISYSDYQNKNIGGGRGRESRDQAPQEDVLNSTFLNPSNVNRCCKLGGLPFRVRKEEVVDFFKDFNVADSDVVIEQKDGRRTGFGLVFLQNEEQVDEAISSLHKQYIGSRYVTVMQAEMRRSRNYDNDDNGY